MARYNGRWLHKEKAGAKKNKNYTDYCTDCRAKNKHFIPKKWHFGHKKEIQLIVQSAESLCFSFEPRVGLEPTTFSLRMKCSTD